MNIKKDVEVAAEYESKFRFYFVALVFTFLAASVQSAPIAEMQGTNRIIELFGWSSLLICGLFSLSFLESSSVIYKNRAIAKSQQYDEATRSLSNEVAQEISNKNSVKYNIAKWSFVLGLILIIISRATYGFTSS